MIEQIRQAVRELLSLNLRRENLIIAFSRPIGFLFMEELYKKYNLIPDVNLDGELKTFEGVQVYNKHPYNEIVIYDPMNAYYPELIRKIVFNVNNKDYATD